MPPGGEPRRSVGGFQFGWWDVVAVFVAAVVAPVDPFQGGDFDVVGGAPRGLGV